MNFGLFDSFINALVYVEHPTVKILIRAPLASETSTNIGIFPASFHPPTLAHVSLIDVARSTLKLHEIVLLPALSNPDKKQYDLPLSERLALLEILLKDDPTLTLAMASHPYFADFTPPILELYPKESRFFLLTGFDTFERLLDLDGRYYPKYHKPYTNREEPLKDLLRMAQIVVAGRARQGRSAFESLKKYTPEPERIVYLDLPAHLRHCSATEVRRRLALREDVSDLIPHSISLALQEKKHFQ